MVHSREIVLLSEGASRDAVILFHGMTGCTHEMEELAVDLHSNGFDCIAPCLSGHGSTIEELAKTPLAHWTRDADNALERLSSYKRVHLVGQSFGTLLALHLALNYPQRCASAVLLSLPWKFRSVVNELLLGVLSRGSDTTLARLGYQKKKVRQGVSFRSERLAYPQHSISAAARIFALRRELRESLPELSVPLLVLQDPTDHHLAPEAVWNFRRDAEDSPLIESKWMHGGYHEMTLGPYYDEVLSNVLAFFRRGGVDAS